MEVAVPVPPGTQLADIAVSLVGLRDLEVAVGARRVTVRLPAAGDPAACSAQLRPREAPTKLHVTVGPLAAGTLPEPEPQPQPQPQPQPRDARRDARVAQIEERLAALKHEVASTGRDVEAAAAAAKEAAQAGARRHGQMARLEQMVRMEPAQLEEMAASVGVGNADAFVAKMQTQLEPLRRQATQHGEDEAAAHKKEARASSRRAALQAERDSLAAELEQLRSQPTPVDGVTDGLAAYSLSPAEFVDCAAFAGAAVPFRSDGAEGAAADRVAMALGDHGWAVCDNFVSEDLVRAVRREVAGPRLSASYEESEIWVGKEAGIGAQLSVPSVRGDRVLWLPDDDVTAGGHSAVAKIIERIDSLILQLMSPRLSSLGGLNERTDAMFAIYPVSRRKCNAHGCAHAQLKSAVWPLAWPWLARFALVPDE
jgi:hypothetical protein